MAEEEKKELVEETKETTNEGAKELTEDELLAKKKKNMMIIIIGLVVLLILLMIGGYFLFIKDDEVPLGAGEGDNTSITASVSDSATDDGLNTDNTKASTTVSEEPVHEHTRGEWTVVKEATCTEEGTEEEICPDCKEKLDERTIPATGHKWVDVTEVVHHDATYEQRWVIDEPAWDESVTETVESGTQTCGTPDMMQVQRTIHHDEIGHYEDWVVDQAYDETIVTGQRCTECGATR